jgi:hypothetical protein
MNPDSTHAPKFLTMESSCTHVEAHLDIERNCKYKGTAKINLEDIGFHPAFSRSLGQHNVDWLCKVFEKEGCRRLDAQNYVPAIISQQHLCAALQAAGKSVDELLASDPSRLPHLHFLAGQVLCLHGRHRIEAGGKVLLAGD